MTVGVARITFYIPGVMSLKAKRKVVKSIIERSKHRFNVSVAEVDDQNLYQKATIAVAVVGNEGREMNSLLDRIIRFMESLGLGEILSHEIELIHFH